MNVENFINAYPQDNLNKLIPDAAEQESYTQKYEDTILKEYINNIRKNLKSQQKTLRILIETQIIRSSRYFVK
jgi:hypothetical protein